MVLWEILGVILAFLILMRFTVCYNKGNACLVGKTVIVTGANSGLGYECCMEFAARGARVIMAVRNLKAAEDCKKKIIEETDNTNITIIHIDLCDYHSVRKFAKEFKNLPNPRLDILVNCAGISVADGTKNEDGTDELLRGNYLGHFLLTHCLADVLKQTENGRIIHVTSCSAFLENLTLSNMLKSQQICGYANSKLLQIIGSSYFAEKFENYNITSNAVHPGLTTTNMLCNFKDHVRYSIVFVFSTLRLLLSQSAREGANTILDAALNVKWKNRSGLYFWFCRSVYKPRKCYDKKFCDDIIKKSIELVQLQKNEEI